MSGYSYFDTRVKSYIDEVREQAGEIRKNFEDMDFENADARTEVERIVEEMTRCCIDLSNEMNSYYFR